MKIDMKYLKEYVSDIKESGIDAEYKDVKNRQHITYNVVDKYVKLMSNIDNSFVTTITNPKTEEKLIVSYGQVKVGNNEKDIEDYDGLSMGVSVIGDKGTNLFFPYQLLGANASSIIMNCVDNEIVIGHVTPKSYISQNKTNYIVCNLENRKSVNFTDNYNYYMKKKNVKMEEVTPKNVKDCIEEHKQYMSGLVLY